MSLFQEKTADVHSEFNRLNEDDDNQLNDYNEEKQDGESQYGSVDKDREKEMSVEQRQPSCQSETNE